MTFEDLRIKLKKKGLNISKSGAWQGRNFTHLTQPGFASALVTLLKKLNISSLTDLGCGPGSYVAVLINSGIEAYGYDGNPETTKLDTSGGHCIGPVDITSQQSWKETDAAMSIEVAEHIPAHLEEAFLTNLVNSDRKLIILSWGTPGQGGQGHINGQTAEDVEEKMKKRGWRKNMEHTSFLKENGITYINKNVQVFERCESGSDCIPASK